MPWNPLNQITLTDDWLFTDPVQGELFKLRHSNAGSVARAMICQATVVNNELFLYQIREISANQNEIIKIEKPEAFENRRIGFQQIYGELDWSIQIEEFIPEPVEDSMIDLGTNKHTRSASMPVTPIKGDTWDEIAADGSWVCDWFWSGTHWLSRQIFSFSGISLGATGGDSASANGSSGLGGPQIVPKVYNLLLLNYTVSCYVQTTNNTTNYWTISLGRRTSLNTNTVLGSVSTQADAPGARTVKTLTLNLLLDLASVDLRMFRNDYALTGTPGLLQFVATLTYRWVRV